MTPHLEADAGAYADIVLLPGDPLRAKWIAETYLEDPGCVNRVRNMLGYTGTYQGRRVSVQSTGMGMASLSIYATELITHYDVRTLIRVGTCGALPAHVQLRDIILATTASTDGGINRRTFGNFDFAPTADFGLLRKVAEAAEAEGLTYHAGGILSSDNFYVPDGYFDPWIEHGVLAVEMETNALYTLAAKFGLRALSVLIVSDSVKGGKKFSPEERERSAGDMVRLVLETVKDLPVEETKPGVVV